MDEALILLRTFGPLTTNELAKGCPMTAKNTARALKSLEHTGEVRNIKPETWVRRLGARSLWDAV